MVVRMRSTRGHTGNRRGHHALTEVRISGCPSCGTLQPRHRVCSNCGKYRGRTVLNLSLKASKKDKKQKEKETAPARM
ncbi:MAG TPA: 50S ribosomal protein L32 [Candidatus Paceibacterota bacterium]